MAGGSVGMVWRKGWLEKSAKGVLEEMEYCRLARKLAKITGVDGLALRTQVRQAQKTLTAAKE